MDRSHFNSQSRLAPSRRSSKRRPTGISRKQKQRQLGFETLEERRVLSANPLFGTQDDFSADAIAKINAEVADSFRNSADLNQYTQQELDSTQSWVVMAAAGTSVSDLSNATGLAVAETNLGIPGLYLVDAGGQSFDQVVDTLGQSQSVDLFFPDLPREQDSV
ncbi:MAG: hypothetical protein RID07_16940, partial [Lacipirellulaceae bacterium]